MLPPLLHAPRSLFFPTAAILLSFLGISLPSVEAQGSAKPWTPPPAIELERLIPEDPAKAAQVIRKSWGPKAFESGKSKVVEKTTVLWVGSHDRAISVVRTDTDETLGTMTRLGDFQALSLTLPNHQQFDYQLRAGETVIGGGNLKIDHYEYTEDSKQQDGVPRGQVVPGTWNDSQRYPGTEREFLVYLPAELDRSRPVALMVFQDGLRHADPDSKAGLRATTVFDNLIAQDAMPPTVGLFINPGRLEGQAPGEKPRNRSVEYDSLGDAYVSFLLEEILPHIAEKHDLTFSDDPAHRGIAGGSSGCACAWTAAWERPDKFGKVLGWVGTFVDIRGANAYPSLVRKTEPKPIRGAFLAGTNDLDNRFGNWPLANQQMETALEFAGYDARYWWGECFHGSAHTAVMLPEMLRWLWRDWEAFPPGSSAP